MKAKAVVLSPDFRLVQYEGSRFLYILTGHLSCQVEHHLFPRYSRLALPSYSQ